MDIKKMFFKPSSIDPANAQIKSLQDELDEMKQQMEEGIDAQLRLLENDATTKDLVANSGNFLGGSYDVVNEEIDFSTLQRLYCSEGWFFIVVHTIAKTISSLPFKLEKRKIQKEVQIDHNGKEEEVLTEVWIEANAEPEYDRLQYPNDLQTPVEFWMLFVIDLLTTGNAYILVDKDSGIDISRPTFRLEQFLAGRKDSDIKGMYRLNPALMEPKLDDEDQMVDGYVMQSASGYLEFDLDQVIHLRMPNPCNPLLGMAPIVPVLKHVLIDRFTSEHMIRFYKQGARLGGVINTKKKLTKEQMGRLTRTFDSNFTGKKNHHKTLILPEGMEYKIIEQNPGETSLIEFAKFNKEPILSAYGVPPVKVGLLDGATYANALIQDKTYWEDTILPLLAFIESGINFSDIVLKPSSKLRFKYDVSGVKALQENYTEKGETAVKLAQAGWTIDEIREKIFSLPPLKDGGQLVPLIERIRTGNTRQQLQLNTEPDDQKSEPTGQQPDNPIHTDLEPTTVSYEHRVAELYSINLSAGIPHMQALQAAMAQATLEGFVPSVPVSNKPTEESQETEQDVRTTTTEEPKEEPEEEEDKEPEESEDKEIEEIFNKDTRLAYAKVLTGEGVKQILEAKFIEVGEFFDRLQKVFIDSFKGKSLTKVDDIDDVLPSDKDLAKFLEKETELTSKSDIDAMKHGHDNTLQSQSLTFPNEDAAKVLEDRNVDNKIQVTDTTKRQIMNTITEAYKEQQSPQEIAARINERFDQIRSTEGRAMTITRTETLTAVSLGQELKKDQFLKEVPDAKNKMLKTWVSAHDSRVRDAHNSLHGVDGETVKHDKEFSNGLKFPRDPSGPANEVINCRCTAIYSTKEDQSLIEGILGNFSPLANEANDFSDES